MLHLKPFKKENYISLSLFVLLLLVAKEEKEKKQVFQTLDVRTTSSLLLWVDSEVDSLYVETI